MNEKLDREKIKSISVRLTGKEVEMVEKILKTEGYHTYSDVFRFLLRQRYSLKYECLGEKDV